MRTVDLFLEVPRGRATSLALVAAFLALSAPGAFGQTDAGHRHGNLGSHASSPRDELGSSAAFDTEGVLWAVSKQGNGVALRQSKDFGKTWSGPTPVNAIAEPVGADGDARPKIAFGPEDAIYITWTQPLSKPYTGLIRFARSLDRGKTFSAPLTVHTDRQEITHRFDAIAVNRQGQIFVAWVDKRDGEAIKAKGGEYRGAALYFAVSDDHGASFRGDFKLADNSCECCRIALLPRSDGSVIAFWRHVFEPNLRDHALATIYPDGHVDGLRRATFDNWAIDACPHHGPSLAADAHAQLHAVWFNLGPEHPGSVYGRLSNDGVKGLRRIGGERAEHPDIAIIGDRVALVWKEFDGEKSQLRGMLSNDDGKTWREISLAATTGASDQPRLLVTNGIFFVFWNTRSNPFLVVPLS